MLIKRFVGQDENLRRLERALGFGFWIFNCRTTELQWSQGVYELLEVGIGEILPDISVFLGFIHPEDRESWSSVLANLTKSRHTDRVVRVIRSSGEMLWVRNRLEGIFERNGNLIAVHGIMLDVSQLQAERESARMDRELARSLTKLTDGSLGRTDATGRLIDTSDWTRFTGQDGGEARDWSGDGLHAIHPDDRPAFLAAWEDGIASELPISYRVRVRDQQGKFTAFKVRALPIEDNLGNIIEWHVFAMPVACATSAIPQIRSPHVRAARALLDWSGPDLAQRSGISFSTIKRVEKSTELVKLGTLRRVQATFEDAGIRFATDGNGDVWVTLRTIS